jgi:hypothetical protein
MKHAVEMGSDVMTYMPNFIQAGSDTQKLMGRIHRHTALLSHEPTFIFSKQGK